MYLAVKDSLPSDYKFPNKSLFNNSAQFTKERRARGFEELLRIMQRTSTTRGELRLFLELEEYIELYRAKAAAAQRHLPRSNTEVSLFSGHSDSAVMSLPPTPSHENQKETSEFNTTSSSITSTQQTISSNHPNNANNNGSERLPSHVTAFAGPGSSNGGSSTTVLPDELRVRKSLQAVSHYLQARMDEAEEHLKSPSVVTTATPSGIVTSSGVAAASSSSSAASEENSDSDGNCIGGQAAVNRRLRAHQRDHLLFALQFGGGTYVVAILFGIIDVSRCTRFEILVTCIAIVLLVLLLRMRHARQPVTHKKSPPLTPTPTTTSSNNTTTGPSANSAGSRSQGDDKKRQ